MAGKEPDKSGRSRVNSQTNKGRLNTTTRSNSVNNSDSGTGSNTSSVKRKENNNKTKSDKSAAGKKASNSNAGNKKTVNGESHQKRTVKSNSMNHKTTNSKSHKKKATNSTSSHRKTKSNEPDKIGMPTILGILLLLAAGCTILWYVYNSLPKVPDADEVFSQYIEYINEKNYDEMYALISEDSQQSVSKDIFINRNKNIYEGIGASDIRIAIGEITYQGNAKSIDYNLTMQTIAGEISFNHNVVVSKNTYNHYRVEWNDGLIFPQLTSDDKVRYRSTQPVRGNILDRNQNPIAVNGTKTSVSIDVNALGEGSEGNIAQIAYILGTTAEIINEKINTVDAAAGSIVPVKTLSLADELKEVLMEIPGIVLEDTQGRIYPYNEKMGHITGYVQSINAEELEAKKDQGYDIHSVIGKVGLESAYEERLRGSTGYEIYIVDKNEEVKETLAVKPVENGEDITVTIDADMQILLYDQLAEDKAAAVVMNHETGEVLALVSTPSYNPNDFIDGLSTEGWNALNEDKDKPLVNRFTSTWTPGSTFKPVTGAIGVTLGSISVEETTSSNGLSWQKDDSWGDYYVTTLAQYGNKVNLKNALTYSDNIYFAKAALGIGQTDMMSRLDMLGFKESIPFDLSMAVSQYGQDGTISSEVQLADSGYGQGEVLVNPLHLVSIYSAFVNQGNMVQPYMEYRREVSPAYWKEDVFSIEAADAVVEGMIQVIESSGGTGKTARISNMTLAGKTGTAEIKASIDDVEGTELGWFTAFTVDEDVVPIIVTAMVEDVKHRGGSHYVIPKVKAVFEALNE